MSAFEDAVIQRIKQLEREVERLQRWERAADLGLGKLSDPNADRVLFWDDSEGALKWLTVDGIVNTDFGKWKKWTPTLTGWSSTTILGARYVIVGKLATCGIMISGTSNDTVARASLPVSAAVNGIQFRGAWGFGRDNGVMLSSAGAWLVSSGSTDVRFFKTMADGAAWSASNTKSVYATFQYEVE